MKPLPRRRPFVTILVTGLLIMPAAASATEPTDPADPHLWLEEVAGEKPLEWVRAVSYTHLTLPTNREV